MAKIGAGNGNGLWPGDGSGLLSAGLAPQLALHLIHNGHDDGGDADIDDDHDDDDGVHNDDAGFATRWVPQSPADINPLSQDNPHLIVHVEYNAAAADDDGK